MIWRECAAICVAKSEKLKISNQLCWRKMERMGLIHFNLPAIFNECCNTPNLKQKHRNQIQAQTKTHTEKERKVIVNKNSTDEIKRNKVSKNGKRLMVIYCVSKLKSFTWKNKLLRRIAIVFACRYAYQFKIGIFHKHTVF